MSLKRVTCSALLLTGLLAGPALARVPVVESRPADAASGVQSASAADQHVNKTDSVTSGPPETRGSGTAHLLNLVEELRGEIMSLRGQVEEQAHLVRQIQLENRDRYLDLDDRITRMGGGSVKPKQPSSEAGYSKKGLQVESALQSSTSVDPVSVDSGLNQAAVAKEEAGYQAAFQLIRDREFDKALVALRQLLKDYPEGRYSDNAQYWLGEVQMAQGKYKGARDDFMLVLNTYPKSPKVPDAAYKLGRLYDLLGEKNKAKKHLESVISDYPDSAAARLSDTYLQNMSGF